MVKITKASEAHIVTYDSLLKVIDERIKEFSRKGLSSVEITIPTNIVREIVGCLVSAGYIVEETVLSIPKCTRIIIIW